MLLNLLLLPFYRPRKTKKRNLYKLRFVSDASGVFDVGYIFVNTVRSGKLAVFAGEKFVGRIGEVVRADAPFCHGREESAEGFDVSYPECKLLLFITFYNG
jgi:hypothetical protein